MIGGGVGGGDRDDLPKVTTFESPKLAVLIHFLFLHQNTARAGDYEEWSPLAYIWSLASPRPSMVLAHAQTW